MKCSYTNVRSFCREKTSRPGLTKIISSTSPGRGVFFAQKNNQRKQRIDNRNDEHRRDEGRRVWKIEGEEEAKTENTETEDTKNAKEDVQQEEHKKQV